MKNVLSPVDLSEVSRHALEHAAALTRALGGRLRVLYVADAFPGGRTIADARADLDAFLATAKLPAGSADATVVIGEPKQEILRAAASSPTDCIVMGTHGRGGFERFVVGSVTEHVMRKSACPVLAVPPGDRQSPPDGTFRRIVCAIDFAPASLRAFEHARALVAAGGTLTLAHAVAWPFGTGPGAMPPEIEALRASLVSDAQSQLERLAAGTRAGVAIEHRVTTGTPYADILAHARRATADLIVTGRHSQATGDLALLGSTTRRVLHDAPCPVLTVG